MEIMCLPSFRREAKGKWTPRTLAVGIKSSVRGDFLSGASWLSSNLHLEDQEALLTDLKVVYLRGELEMYSNRVLIPAAEMSGGLGIRAKAGPWPWVRADVCRCCHAW